MKSVLFILLAVALLVSCSSDHPYCECLQVEADALEKHRLNGMKGLNNFEPSEKCKALSMSMSKKDAPEIKKCGAFKKHNKEMKHIVDLMEETLRDFDAENEQ
ncbi:MAG: hypothetical protein COA38_20125 [Fluviicola sp.]|nr:MAG: hypothetical protein COA38_20125 [Fluviicola sp.]